MSIVVDCSLALNWVMPDEGSGQAEAVLERVVARGGVVPPLFKIEIGNALLTGVRRRRITAALFDRALERIGELPLQTDTQGAERLWTTCVDLASKYDLSLYDAVYLELALRVGLPLATFDKKLEQAAVKAGVARHDTQH